MNTNTPGSASRPAIWSGRLVTVVGAVLWTGYLGGAITTHLRVGNPMLSHTLLPIHVAVFLWGGLFLRDARVKNLVPRSA